MNLDRTTTIATLPVKTVRDALRELRRYGDDSFSVTALARQLNVSLAQSQWLCENLRADGVLVRKPRPHDGKTERLYYGLGDNGTRFLNATMLKRIDRAKVDHLLADLLARARTINADPELCYFVNELRLFGSAMDGKTESFDFGDVDVAYIMQRRQTPAGYKKWTDWSLARARAHNRNRSMMEEYSFAENEVLRKLRNRSPYISLHPIDDVIGIGADSIRLFIAPEGEIASDGGGSSGEALSRAVIRHAQQTMKERAQEKMKKAKEDAVTIDDRSLKQQMIDAVKSLAFDILRAIDETQPPEMLTHSIAIAHERISAYDASKAAERTADILRDALSIDIIEQAKAAANEEFIIFLRARETRPRWH